MRISYVNGSFIPHEQATIHIDDRGTDFADGVYEVIAYKNRKLIDLEPHFARLKNSLAFLHLAEPMNSNTLRTTINTLIGKNKIDDGLLYLRITRGVAERAHPFPSDTKTSLVMTVKEWKKPSDAEYTNGVKVITHPEIRWAWRHIKSICLLPNIMAKQKAADLNAKEAWFVEKDGTITEGSSSNVYIVKNGIVITQPESNDILGGITRKTILNLAQENNIKIDERKFTLTEAISADEAFMTSTSMGIIAVNEIDGKKIPLGTTARRLQGLYESYVNAIGELPQIN